jgi:cytochrome b561
MDNYPLSKNSYSLTTIFWSKTMNAKTGQNQQIIGYDKGYKWLHWVMAILILLMFLAIFGFAQATTDTAKIEMLMGHSTIGSLIFILFVIRFSKRFIFKSPRPTHDLNTTTNIVAKVAHLVLYSLLFYVPVTGYLTARAHELPVLWFGQVNLAKLIEYEQSNFDMLRGFHEIGVQILMLLVVMHIGAALLHAIVKKDGVFSSMWPARKTRL